MDDNDCKRKIEKLFGDAEPDATEQDGGSLPRSVVLKTMPCDPFQAFPLWTVMSALLLHFALHGLFTWKDPSLPGGRLSLTHGLKAANEVPVSGDFQSRRQPFTWFGRANAA